MSRTHQRKGFDPETRTTLLEGDADNIENTVAGIQKSMQRVVTSLVTATITFGTSAVLLALNLVVTR